LKSKELSHQMKAVQVAILNYSSKHLRDYPWRRRKLSPFQMMICEVLLRRTHADTIVEHVDAFLSRFSNPEQILDVSESTLTSLLMPLGLQNQRAKQIRSMAEHLSRNEGGKVPNELEALLEVPGIGAYTARAVLSFAYNKPYAIVDSNVMRVYGRVFRGTCGAKPTLRDFQEMADALLPSEGHKQYNFALLDLGAMICYYSRPRCRRCPIKLACDSVNAYGHS
jgi:A/G-specific adenine glycosylase